MFVDCINSWAKIKSEKQYLTITWSYSAAGKLNAAAQEHSRGNENSVTLCGKLTFRVVIYFVLVS